MSEQEDLSGSKKEDAKLSKTDQATGDAAKATPEADKTDDSKAANEETTKSASDKKEKSEDDEEEKKDAKDGETKKDDDDKDAVKIKDESINDDAKEAKESGDVETKPATLDDCLKLLKQSFEGYDYNGNGTVAEEEVMEAWVMCQEEWNQPVDHDRCKKEASIFMTDIDKDGDSQVDFQEYVKYFRHLWLLSQGCDV